MEDGTAALDVARRERPELIFLDWSMPGATGLEVCRALRADAETAHIKVVMLTARTERGDREAGFDAGADDYITKPFSPVELLDKVSEVLGPGALIAAAMTASRLNRRQANVAVGIAAVVLVGMMALFAIQLTQPVDGAPRRGGPLSRPGRGDVRPHRRRSSRRPPPPAEAVKRYGARSSATGPRPGSDRGSPRPTPRLSTTSGKVIASSSGLAERPNCALPRRPRPSAASCAGRPTRFEVIRRNAQRHVELAVALETPAGPADPGQRPPPELIGGS